MRKDRQSCRECYYYVSQSCRRYAPRELNSSGRYPEYPIIVEGFTHWCGEWREDEKSTYQEYQTPKPSTYNKITNQLIKVLKQWLGKKAYN